MTKIVTVDVTIRFEVEMAEGEDILEILDKGDIDFAWPDGEAAMVSQDIMAREIVATKIIEKELPVWKEIFTFRS